MQIQKSNIDLNFTRQEILKLSISVGRNIFSFHVTSSLKIDVTAIQFRYALI